MSKSVNRFLIGLSLTLHVVLHEQKRKTERRTDATLIVRVTRLAALYNLSPTIVPYISEVVNVTTYIWLYMNINVLDCSTWNSNQLMHPMCEYVYAHVYMSMRSLRWCDGWQIAVLIIWSWCKFQRAVDVFCFLKNSMLCCCECLLFFPLFFHSFEPFTQWIGVPCASTEHRLIFDNHFLYSEPYYEQCSYRWICNTIGIVVDFFFLLPPFVVFAFSFCVFSHCF